MMPPEYGNALGVDQSIHHEETSADTSNYISNNGSVEHESLIDPRWRDWAMAADDAQLIAVLKAARLERHDPEQGTDLPTLVRQITTLEAEAERRANLRGGVYQATSGDLVTFADTPLTDLGNAERFAARYGHKVRWCEPWQRWLVFDGRRWAVDDRREIERFAKITVRAIYAEASTSHEKAERKAIADWAIRSETRQRIIALIESAKSELAISPDVFDRDPFLLNVENGTIDLRTGAINVHNALDFITKLAPVNYDPAADCPAFLAFLERITGNEPELLAYLHRLLGYCLTGDTREQVFPIAWGTGANGKSTLFSSLLHALGDYGSTTPVSTLMQRRGESIPNDLAALRGKRFVLASEADDGHRLSEAMVKQVTGGDRITARFMRAEWFEFEPQFKLVLATNHKPMIRGTDHAIWRRIHLVPFAVTIPTSEQDGELPEKLRAESSGLLAWLVDGCLAWQTDGLRPPVSVQNATTQYRADSDVLAAWIDDTCVLHKDAHATANALYRDYTEWCEANNERPLAQRTLGTRLKERGFTQDRDGSGTRLWRGIGLKASGSR